MARHAALFRQEPAHRQAVLLPPPFSAIISRMPTDLLNPCNDYVFKRLFAASPLLLADLINAVRSEALRMKWSKCSIPASNRKNSWANSSSSISWRRTARDGVTTSRCRSGATTPGSARSAYYLARTLTSQLDSGQDYQGLKPVIGIHLLDFDLFTAPEQSAQALWCFEMRDRKRPDVLLGNELQLNILELPKADRLGVTQAGLAAWITLFEHWQEENRMAAIDYPPP
jgi:hypothetical protein